MMTKPVRHLGTIAVLLLAAACLAGCGGNSATKQPEGPTTQEQVGRAQSMFRAGRVSEALEIMAEAVQSEPDNARMHSIYGTLCFQAGRYPEAEKAFLAALELDPYLTDARNFLGAVYAEEGRSNEAEEQYLIALRDPAYPSPELVYLNLGLLYAARGEDTRAVEQLRNAVEIDPKFYKGHYELASVLDRLDQTREAVREYEVAEPAYLQSGEYHYRLGMAYFRLGETWKARERLERAISVAPGSNSAARAAELLDVMD
jgi:Tfp pilus assembly protein PilF